MFPNLHVKILLATHGFIIAITPTSTDRQDQGTLAVFASLFVYSANLWYDLSRIPASDLHIGFTFLHGFLLVASVVVNLTIPRRPGVFRSNYPVDGERTVSLLSRFTLSWASSKLSYAMRKGGLDFSDLPLLASHMSSHALVTDFNRFTASRLWQNTILAHRSKLALQWILTFLQSFAILAPQFAMYQLIRLLEENHSNPDPLAGLWLVSLGIAQLLQPWIEAWVLWIGWCHVSLPIYVQLSALIMEKSMRMKDVKDKQSDGENLMAIDEEMEYLDTSSSQSVISRQTTDSGDHNPPEKAEVSAMNRQDESNLISIDVQRISEFFSYNGMCVLLPTQENLIPAY